MKQLSGKLDVAMIIDLIRNGDTHALVGEHRVKVSGVRLTTFATKGTDCICCGREGKFFRIEDNGSGPHLNLYAYGTDNQEKLMTRDHIIPRSKNGPETVENMSPMCLRCNNVRGTKDQAEFLADWAAGHYEKGGKIDREKMASRKAARDARGKVVKLPPEDIRKAIDAHIEKYGAESHMKSSWVGGLNKKWKREELLDECVRLGDDLGVGIMVYLMEADTKRSKVRVYARNTYLPGHNAAMQSLRDRGGQPTQLLSMLMTRVQKHLDYPSDHTEAKLREMYDTCKEFRNENR